MRVHSRRIGLEFIGNIETDGFEHDLEPRVGPESREEPFRFEVVWAEIVKYGRFFEQALDVDELNRPDPLAKHALANLESSLSLALRDPRSMNIAFYGSAKHSRHDRAAIIFDIGWGLDENFTKFCTTVRAKDDGVSPLESRAGVRVEPSDVPHRTITNQVGVLHKCLNLSLEHGSRKVRNHWCLGSRNSLEFL